MEDDKRSDQEKTSKEQEELKLRISFGSRHYQPTSQSTDAIIASIKPLPPGILDRAKKTLEEKEQDKKPAINLYNVGRMTFTPPIKTKEKGGKIVTGKEKEIKEQKQSPIPLQMTTSISGQSLMFKKPVLKKPAVMVTEENKKSSSFMPGGGEKSFKKEEEKTKKPAMTLSILKYISVSVRARRVIYDKSNFNDLFNNMENYLSSPEDELKKEILDKIEEYKGILSSEFKKLETTPLPVEGDDSFKEAKDALMKAIRGFQDCIEDFETVMKEKDIEVLDDCSDLMEKTFKDMDIYFELREAVKSKISSN